MLNIKTETFYKKHSLFLMNKQIRLKQIKPIGKEPKGLKPSSDIDATKPFYELQINDITSDASNSMQYIMDSARKFNTTNLIIYKHEFGSKTVFYKS